MYSIDVTSADDVRQQTGIFGQMIRSMLEDRFALKAHIESRPFPVYALVRAKTDGALGPQLHASTVDCAAETKKEQDAIDRDRNAAIAATLANTGRPVCGTRFLRTGGLTAGAITMGALAANLSNGSAGLDRIVLDRTNLSGRFDVDLQWARPAPSAAADSAALSDGPSVFTAVQEQLGLRLERRDEPMDVLVVDHIEPPTPN